MDSNKLEGGSFCGNCQDLITKNKSQKNVFCTSCNEELDPKTIGFKNYIKKDTEVLIKKEGDRGKIVEANHKEGLFKIKLRNEGTTLEKKGKNIERYIPYEAGEEVSYDGKKAMIKKSDTWIFQDDEIIFKVKTIEGNNEYFASEEDLSDTRPERLDKPEFLKYNLAWKTKVAPFTDRSEALIYRTSRIQPFKHQLATALDCINHFPPQKILADEVGLGKTIEAGIVVKELLNRDIVDRVLIIPPARLVNKWKKEFDRRFNLSFTHYDRNMIEVLEKNHETNPWDLNDLVVTSLHWIRREENREKLLNNAKKWDLIIFDEAHKLKVRMNRKKSKKSHELAKKLKEETEGFLFLTATPFHLELYELWSILKLLGLKGFWKNPQYFRLFYEELQSGDVEEYLQYGTIMMIQEYLEWSSQSDERLEEIRSKNINEIFLPLFLPLKDRTEFIEKTLSETKEDLSFYKKDEINDLDKKKKSIEEEIKEIKKRFGKSEDLEKSISTIVENLHPLKEMMTRNTRKILKNLGMIKHERITKTKRWKWTQKEKEIYEDIENYGRNIYNIFGEKNHKGFASMIYRKIAASSLYAAKKSLQKRKVKLESPKEELKDDLSELKRDIKYKESEEEDPTDIYEYYSSDIQKEKREVESIIRKIEDLDVDTKLDELRNFLENNFFVEGKERKIIIFTQYYKTAKYLANNLSPDYRTCIYSGQGDGGEIYSVSGKKVNEVKREKAVEFFKGEGNIMVSTSAGSEGLDFQFCNVVLNYDLPWNPMKIEQRIGRIDRIGQENEKVYVYNLLNPESIEGSVYKKLEERINLFQEVIGGLQPILGELEDKFKEVIKQGKTKKEITNEINTFIDDYEERKEINEKLEMFTMDSKVFDTTAIENAEPPIKSHEIKNLIELYLNKVGGKLEKTSQNLYKIYHKDTIRPEIEKATFDHEVAVENSEAELISLNHELLNEAMDEITQDKSAKKPTMLSIGDEEFKDRVLIGFNYLIDLSGVEKYKSLETVAFDANTNDLEFSIVDEFDIDKLMQIVSDIENYSKKGAIKESNLLAELEPKIEKIKGKAEEEIKKVSSEKKENFMKKNKEKFSYRKEVYRDNIKHNKETSREDLVELMRDEVSLRFIKRNVEKDWFKKWRSDVTSRSFLSDDTKKRMKKELEDQFEEIRKEIPFSNKAIKEFDISWGEEIKDEINWENKLESFGTEDKATVIPAQLETKNKKIKSSFETFKEKDERFKSKLDRLENKKKVRRNYNLISSFIIIPSE